MSIFVRLAQSIPHLDKIMLTNERYKPPMSAMDEEELASLNNDPITVSEEAFAAIEKTVEENRMCDNTKLQSLLKRQLRWVDSRLS